MRVKWTSIRILASPVDSLVDYWYCDHPARWLLTPLSGLFRLVASGRRWAYGQNLFHVQTLPVPVLVIGNLTLGGTGKTPLVIWLAEFLKGHGYSPGIVNRGYKGQARHYPQRVYPHSDPALVGDEAILLARRTACPVVVGPNRVAAAKALLAHFACNVLLSDDGLQHYALNRDLEIVVIDGTRRFGNGHCLPAGPLRESLNRLHTVDLVVSTGHAQEGEVAMDLQLQGVCNLKNAKQYSLQAFQSTPVHAVAGIGNPKRFFNQLREAGLTVYEHPFPDHYRFQPRDLAFRDELPVLMTEKDAVKCTYFARANHWYVATAASLPASFRKQVLNLLQQASKRMNQEISG